jgi:hypothetical protein
VTVETGLELGSVKAVGLIAEVDVLFSIVNPRLRDNIREDVNSW